MYIRTIPTVLVLTVALLPRPTLASVTLQSIFSSFGSVLSSFVQLGAAVALVLFLWGVIVFMRKSGDDKEIANGKQFMLWGIVLLSVLVSLWGIVAIVQNTLGIEDKSKCDAPTVDPSGGQGKTCV